MLRPVRRALATVLVAGLFAAGCGSGGSHAPVATVVLDFTPNAVHAGIYAAIARGYDRSARLRLHVVAPTASTDSIKLLETDHVTSAILDIHDLAIADQSNPTHPGIVGVMAIVERPLASVIAAPRIGTPRQLIGKLVGVTGAPSDLGVLHSVVQGSGGDPALVKTVTIGFDAVPDLLAGRVAAATAFWNDEGVTLRQRRPGFHVFRAEEYGAPPYPELVLCVTRRTLAHNPGLVGAMVRALVRGYSFTLAQPAAAAADLEARVPGLDHRLVASQLAALLGAFRAPVSGRVGALDPAVLRAWARWEPEFGVVHSRPDVATAFDVKLSARAAAR